MYEIEVGGLAFADIAVLPRHSFRSPTRKFQVCKHCADRMVIAQSAERLMRIFLGERKGIGLTFAANVQFWVQNYFFIKKNWRQRCVFLLLSYEVENEYFRICFRTNNHIQRKSRAVVS